MSTVEDVDVKHWAWDLAVGGVNHSIPGNGGDDCKMVIFAFSLLLLQFSYYRHEIREVNCKKERFSPSSIVDTLYKRAVCISPCQAKFWALRKGEGHYRVLIEYKGC